MPIAMPHPLYADELLMSARLPDRGKYLLSTLPTFKHRPQSGMTAARVNSGALAPPTTYRQFLLARGVHSRNCAM